MPYWVYVLRSERDGMTYTGSTKDLEARLQEHADGRVPSTRNRRSLTLIYTEEYATRAEAVRRERYFKTAEGGVEKQRLIREAKG